MADRTIDNYSDEIPVLPEILEKVLLFALDEGKNKLDEGRDLVPFTSLVIKENLFLESHPGDNPEQCFAFAKHTVEGARGAEAYALCYDGYIETDDGVKDAVIAEGGIPGASSGYAIAYLYTVKEGEAPVFETEPAYVGEAPNFMENLKEASEYSDDLIDEKYLDEEEIEEN